jgi:hypothetical protein
MPNQKQRKGSFLFHILYNTKARVPIQKRGEKRLGSMTTRWHGLEITKKQVDVVPAEINIGTKV